MVCYELESATMLDPVFQFLDWIIAEWGVYLFLAFVWLSLILIAWIFGGGLRRKIPNQPHVRPASALSYSHTHHRHHPIIIHEYDPPDDGMD